MSRFLVTNNAHFEPFSFDEIIKPVAYAQERFDNTVDAYDALNLETSALGQYISENPDDNDAKILYDTYNEKLKSLQENLWNNGVTAQTRRELAAAREGFAGIQKIKDALNRRQAAGKEYWDYVHKNPDSIVGVDPGSFGLNYYLKDDTFGNNWFAYNGKDFLSEVGADAKARALEMREKVKTEREVPGYITRIAERGFSNDEVDAAIEAVQNGTYESLGEGAVKVLAETLSDHLKSTGAIKGQNISEEQYNRFFGYGRTGLAQGIFEPEVKDFADVYAKAGGKEGSGDGIDIENPFSSPLLRSDGTVVDIKSQPLSDWSKEENRQNKRFANGEVLNIKTPDGRVVSLDNVWDTTDLIFNSPAREQAKKVLGIDIGGDPAGFFNTSASRQVFSLPELDKETGERIQVTDPKTGELVDKMLTMATGKLSKREAKELGLDLLAEQYGVTNPTYFGVYANDSNGNARNLHRGATKALTEFVLQHQKYVDEMRRLNPGINFANYTLTPAEEASLRDKKWAKEAGITASMSSADIRDIMRARSFTGKYTPSYIATSDPAYKELKAHYSSKLLERYNAILSAEGKKNKNGVVSLMSGSPYVIKERGEGNDGYGGTEYHNLAEVLGTDKDGNVLSENLQTVYIDPIEIAKNPENPRIDFTTKKAGHIYSAPADAFGSHAQNLLTATDRTGLTIPEKVAYMMMPLVEPAEVIKMSDEEASMWWDFTRNLIGAQNYDITAKDFVRDSNLLNELIGWVSRYVNIPLTQVVGSTQKSINIIPNMK